MYIKLVKIDLSMLVKNLSYTFQSSQPTCMKLQARLYKRASLSLHSRMGHQISRFCGNRQLMLFIPQTSAATQSETLAHHSKEAADLLRDVHLEVVVVDVLLQEASMTSILLTHALGLSIDLNTPPEI